MKNRDKQADLMKLATRVLKEAAANNPFGLSEKRPFGFSGDPAYDVLEIVGVRPEDGLYGDTALEYGRDLYAAVGKFIVRAWKEKVLS